MKNTYLYIYIPSYIFSLMFSALLILMRFALIHCFLFLWIMFFIVGKNVKTLYNKRKKRKEKSALLSAKKQR